MITAKKGFLANGKISPSQLKTWVKSEKDYIKWYIKGLPRPTSKYMEFGTFIHKAIEEGKSENPTLDMMIGLIPRLDAPEIELNVPTTINKVEVVLNGILDNYDVVDDHLIDYKTGKVGNWSDEIVAQDLQFKFYALMHKLSTKRDLKKVTIVHLHTTEEDGNVVLTGEFDVYEYTPTKADLDEVKDQFKKFIKWANALTPEMLSDEASTETTDTIAKMRAIREQQEILDAEYDNLKAIVLADMEKTGAMELKTNDAHVYFQSRKTYEYPAEIKALEAGVKTAKETWEKDHEPKTITKTFTFKINK